MASDRSIGGFGHTWGADSRKVQRKRRLLEEEGVVFEEDGKIHPHCFVNEVSVVASASASVSVSATTSKSSSAAKRSRKRKGGDDDSTTNESTNKIYFNGTISISETSLKQEILNLLGKRQPGKRADPVRYHAIYLRYIQPWSGEN